jgi:hypothetical protein
MQARGVAVIRSASVQGDDFGHGDNAASKWRKGACIRYSANVPLQSSVSVGLSVQAAVQKVFEIAAKPMMFIAKAVTLCPRLRSTRRGI